MPLSSTNASMLSKHGDSCRLPCASQRIADAAAANTLAVLLLCISDTSSDTPRRPMLVLNAEFTSHASRNAVHTLSCNAGGAASSMVRAAVSWVNMPCCSRRRALSAFESATESNARQPASCTQYQPSNVRIMSKMALRLARGRLRALRGGSGAASHAPKQTRTRSHRAAARIAAASAIRFVVGSNRPAQMETLGERNN